MTASKQWMDQLPVAVQQAMKRVSLKEHWTAQNDEALSIAFEQLVSLPNSYQFVGHLSRDQHETFTLLVQLFAYLRVEQALYFIRVMPEQFEMPLLDILKMPDEAVLAETINLLSRLDTLAKLNMIDRVFSTERRGFVMDVLDKALTEMAHA